MRIDLNAPQTRFLRALADHRFILFGAGVGCGKTRLLQIIAVYLASKNPGMPGLVASHIYNHLKVELLPGLLDNLKAAKLLRLHRKQDRVLELTNGGSIQYGSADRSTSLEGRNVAWGLGDEMRFWPLESYQRFVARVRIKGAPMPRVCGFSTLETNWLEDEWKQKENRHVIYATTFENEHNLRDGYITDLQDTLSPEMFDQYVMAKWVTRSASVYGNEFDQDLCIEPDLYDPDHVVQIGMDPGMRFPAGLFFQHLGWCQRHGVKDCLHVIDELVPNDTPLVRMAALIRTKAARNGWRLGPIYLDPFGGNQRDQIHGITVADMLEDDYKFEVIYSYDKVETNILNGIDVVKSRLLSASGARRLFFDANLDGQGLTLRNVIRAIQSYRWPERKPGQRVKSNPVEDEAGHIMDALRYPCVNLFPPAGAGIKVV